MRILIVDDMKENIELLGEVLRKKGYEVVSAANGAVALEKLGSDNFDLIVSDILMPVVDGFQLCRKCKENDKLKGIPLVFYTAAYTDEKDEEFALNLGADKFIRKPVLPREFITIIQGVISDAQKSNIKPKAPNLIEEKDILKAHNELLIKKLEDKVLELESEISERKRVEKALLESEEKYRILFDSSVTGTYLTSLNGRIINTSKTGGTILGFDRAQNLVGRNISEFYKNQADRDKIMREIAKSDLCSFEIEMTKINGTDIICRAFASKVNILGDEFILTSGYDITEQKQAEKISAKRKEQYYSLVNSTDDSVYLLDGSGTFLFINKKYLSRLGLSLDKVLGKNYADFHSEDNTKKLLNNIKRVFETGRSFQEEYQSERDGKHFLRTFSPVKGPEVVTSATILSKDISGFKQAEEALLASEEKYRSLFHSSLMGITLSYKGKVLEINEAGSIMLGYDKPQDLIGTNTFKIYKNPKDREKIIDKVKTDRVGDFEFELVKKDGFSFFASVFMSALDLYGKKILLSSFIDISKRRQAEEELERSRAQLRNLTAYLQSVREEERKKIAREIHDELGQALTAMKMDLSWLRKRFPKEKKILREKAKSMSKLIDTTIRMVKRISTELRPGLLDDLGLAAALEWQAEEFQDRTGIACTLTINPVDITLDEDRSTSFFRIFQETLTNIGRHAKATKVVASLKEKDSTLELKVKDNGQGITKEQVSDPKSFGLLGIKERVHLWGGKVEIRGVKAKGTTVIVKIPVDKE